MITISAVSSVSYCSFDCIKKHLDHFLECGSIDFYVLIKHYAEADEKKDHWNIYIVPAKRLDTSVIQNVIQESDPNNDIPLKTMPFRKSKFADWVLYHLHDESYLKSKNLYRDKHYRYEDLISSDSDMLHEMYSSIGVDSYRKKDVFIELALNQVPFHELALSGLVPTAQIAQYKQLYECVQTLLRYEASAKKRNVLLEAYKSFDS